MEASTKQFLARLLAAPGPSGFESAAAAVWREEAETFADQVWGDVHGNSFAACGLDGSPRIMLAGHIDEIGLMIHYIDDQGYLYLKAVGGWDPQVLVGQRVEVLAASGPVIGVVGRRAPHLLEKEDREKAVAMKDLWVDVGVHDVEEVRRQVKVGDVAVIRSDTLELGGGCLAARALDDRIGALVALEALRRSAERGTPAHVVAVATTQEEIGARSGGGARTSSYGLEPDAAIIVDVTHATDHPHVDRKEHGDIRLGAGPVLTRGAVASPAMLRLLVEAAERAGVSYQMAAAPAASGTDADQIFTTRAGVATGLVSIPNRYMHSPSQLVDPVDVEAAATLIAELLHGLSPDTSFLPD
ncbi:MAG: M42 family metallopeptidase [Gemmatimonadota bacterium]